MRTRKQENKKTKGNFYSLKILPFLMIILVYPSTSKAQFDMDDYALYADTSAIYGQDSTYIYDANLNKQWFHFQKDVYCFKTMSETEYGGSFSSCVYDMDYWDEITRTKFNEVHFKSTSTMLERAMQIEAIHDMSVYRISALALTNTPSDAYTERNYFRTDDHILITFNNPTISSTEINNFKSAYNLELVHAPSNTLNNTVSWTYIFKVLPTNGVEVLTITLAQFLVENETTLIKHAEPNLYATKSLACSPTTEVGLDPGGIDGTWHIRNQGGVIWSGIEGVSDADADICECWGEGYTGDGIKIGVIDFGGIQFSHNDFEGTNINEIYVPSEFSPYYTDDYFIDASNGHGMQVTGIIAATPNNNSFGYRYAVGAAYDAEVRPAIISTFVDGDIGSNAEIALAIQDARLNNIDIVNMSFRTFGATGSIETQIANAVATGRPDGLGGYKGMVFVAAVGNDDFEASNFPANLPNVIGVGWSNPEDFRSSYSAGDSDNWTTNPLEGSSYGDPSFNYDVVAPGELIMTTNSGDGSYIFAKGSSMAAPIVSSIAAILLEANPDLTYADVQYAIREGAEKVNPGTYNYSMFGGAPGYNNEMFYGRVSCINSLNVEVVGLENKIESINLSVTRESKSTYTVYIPTTTSQQSYVLQDITGRIIMTGVLEQGIGHIPIDLSTQADGLYIFALYDETNKLGTAKLIK